LQFALDLWVEHLLVMAFLDSREEARVRRCASTIVEASANISAVKRRRDSCRGFFISKVEVATDLMEDL